MFFGVRVCARARESEFLMEDTSKGMPSRFGAVERGKVKNVFFHLEKENEPTVCKHWFE